MEIDGRAVVRIYRSSPDKPDCLLGEAEEVGEKGVGSFWHKKTHKKGSNAMERSSTMWGFRRRYQMRRVLLVLIVGLPLFFTGCATVNKGGNEGVRLKEPLF